MIQTGHSLAEAAALGAKAGTGLLSYESS